MNARILTSIFLIYGISHGYGTELNELLIESVAEDIIDHVKVNQYDSTYILTGLDLESEVSRKFTRVFFAKLRDHEKAKKLSIRFYTIEEMRVRDSIVDTYFSVKPEKSVGGGDAEGEYHERLSSYYIICKVHAPIQSYDLASFSQIKYYINERY